MADKQKNRHRTFSPPRRRRSPNPTILCIMIKEFVLFLRLDFFWIRRIVSVPRHRKSGENEPPHLNSHNFGAPLANRAKCTNCISRRTAHKTWQFRKNRARDRYAPEGVLSLFVFQMLIHFNRFWVPGPILAPNEDEIWRGVDIWLLSYSKFHPNRYTVVPAWQKNFKMTSYRGDWKCRTWKWRTKINM